MRKKILGSQVKRFISGVSDHGNVHLLEIETDLVQTTCLLANAVEKLGTSFIALHDAVKAQQGEMDMLLTDFEADDPKIQRLRAIQKEITKNTNEAVLGLQFQDLTSQLLSRTLQRIIGLRQVLQELESHGSSMPVEGHEDDMVTRLNDLNKQLDIQSEELKGILRKAVHQKDLESGEIEMF